jgi:cysteine desulfurase family protein
MTRIYLDNAATSWPKPPALLEAVDSYLRECGVAVGRGATAEGARLQKVVDRCRLRVATLFGAASQRSIVFAFNGTDALNLALHGLLHDGGHVVATDIEHNSVLRPLAALQQRVGLEATYVAPDAEGVLSAGDVAAAIREETRLVVVSHVSNVTGAIQPVEEIVVAAKRRGVRVLIDAAQSAGHLPIDVQTLQVDLLAASGHKGLLGPLGTGVLYVAPGVEGELDAVRQGGTGTVSEQEFQPETMPDKFECGNHNAPGLVGLEAALEWIEATGVDAIRRHEVTLSEQLVEGLDSVPGVSVYGPRELDRRSGPVSFSLEGYSPQEAAAILDEHFGVECRAGLHCAPRMHRCLGTFDAGGTVRFSPGAFSTHEQVAAAIDAVRQIAGG